MSIFDVPLSESRDPNELAHFGVKGMKWGQRRAKKRSEIKARIAKQGGAKISLMYDKNSPQHYVNGTFGTGTLRARGLSKALIRSKGARCKALGRAIVIQKARSNRRWKTPRWPARLAAPVTPDSETAIRPLARPLARPGSGTGRTTTTPPIEAGSSASTFVNVVGSASED